MGSPSLGNIDHKCELPHPWDTVRVSRNGKYPIIGKYSDECQNKKLLRGKYSEIVKLFGSHLGQELALLLSDPLPLCETHQGVDVELLAVVYQDAELLHLLHHRVEAHLNVEVLGSSQLRHFCVRFTKVARLQVHFKLLAYSRDHLVVCYNERLDKSTLAFVVAIKPWLLLIHIANIIGGLVSLLLSQEIQALLDIYTEVHFDFDSVSW